MPSLAVEKDNAIARQIAAQRDIQASRPNPEQIDDLCIAFDTARAKLQAAQQSVEESKAALLPIVRAHGSVPAGAEKTKRLEGTLYVADSTVTTTTEVIEPAVVELMCELLKARKSALFHEVFEPITKHVLRKTGGELLRLGIAAMPQARQAHILGIYARCFDAKSKAPTLSVDLVQAVKQREEEALAKAAKKAAKKGGSK